ncbi:MAG: DUF2231 domain-containing protein [Nitrospirae bacterium]|nr:DUF2231 domain-containing protein [Nitrospirota bacterium]
MVEHPIHPVVVHFPIALLFTAVFFEILGFLLRREQYRQFGFWLLILGFLSGLVAAGFGLWGEAAAVKMGVPEKAIERHESFAVSTLITFGLLLIYRRWARDRWSSHRKTIYISAAVAGLLLLGTTGYFGGELVYEYGAGVSKTAPGRSGSSEATPPAAKSDRD